MKGNCCVVWPDTDLNVTDSCIKQVFVMYSRADEDSVQWTRASPPLSTLLISLSTHTHYTLSCFSVNRRHSLYGFIQSADLLPEPNITSMNLKASSRSPQNSIRVCQDRLPTGRCAKRWRGRRVDEWRNKWCFHSKLARLVPPCN